MSVRSLSASGVKVFGKCRCDSSWGGNGFPWGEFFHKPARYEWRRIMKRLVILGIIACVGLLAGSTALIGGPAGPPGGLNVKVLHPLPFYRFVGYSQSAPTIGALEGPLGMHAICQESFGPEARMCTTEEFWKTPPTDTTLEDTTIRGWIQPVIIAAYYDPEGEEGLTHIFIEYTGIRAKAETGQAPTRYFSCGQWSNDKHQGLTSTSTGRVELRDCNVTPPPKVTCCRPATIGP